MQRLEVSGAVRPIYRSLGVKRLTESMNDSRRGQTDLDTARPTMSIISYIFANLTKHDVVSGLRTKYLMNISKNVHRRQMSH